MAMKIKTILTDVQLVIADLEVNLGTQVRHAPTLCAVTIENGKKQLIPLNTPDGRPIFMNRENAIDFE
jgi:hypothetical protein